jgi:hypothetical protein
MASGSDGVALQRVAQDRPAKVRDIRLDVFRGLALLLIAVTHMGGNWLVELLPSHFGFSSSTETFVFCSGVASGLAFGSLFVRRGFWLGTLRVAHRIWEIYWAHLATFVAVLALSVALAAWLGRPEIPAHLQHDVFLDNPSRGLLALVSLTYLPPLFDILPLYIVLLAMIPLVMAARLLSKTLPFILVGAIYLYLWTVGFQMPGSPADPARGWLFNPLGWQLVFFAGFFIAMRWVEIPAPGTPWAVAAALTVVLVSVPLSWHVLYQNVDLLGYLREKILPASERSNFHILRFIHFLALAYLAVSVIAFYPRLLATAPARILATTGRETLAAFLASIPIAILGGTALDQFGASPASVIAATLLSWAAIIGVAYLANYVEAKPWAAPRELRPADARPAVAVPVPAKLAAAPLATAQVAVAG